MNSIDHAVRPLRIAMRLLPWIVWTGCGEVLDTAPKVATASDGLVFVRPTDAGATDVFLARIADGTVRQLTETPEFVESNPEWSSSVLRVLYVMRPADDPMASPKLMMRDPLRRDASSVSEKTFLDEWDASVSADGTRVVYVFEAPPNIRPSRGVRVVSPLTSRDEVMGSVPGASAYLSPRFSPNAGSVAVQVHRPGRGDDLWLLLGEDRPEPLVDNPGWHDTAPRFASSGSSILFSRSAYHRVSGPRERRAEPLGGGDICRIHLPAKQVDCVVRSEDAREQAVETSPTREEMVFVRERDGATDLFVAGLAGENERQLTDSPDRAERLPVWSPDGDRIAYVDGRPPQHRIVVIDRRGRVLFETAGDQPGWAPPVRTDGD